MTAEQIKSNIKEALQSFAKGNLSEKSIELFEKLGYVTERRAPLNKPTFAEFKDTYIGDKKFDEAKAKTKDWKYVDLLFQLSKEEVQKQASLFDTKQVDRTVIETYLFFAIELNHDEYSRTELSVITREVNRLFPMPAMILFKHGKTITVSAINRRLHKRDESKDVLEKVTLIKDIVIESPHRAHIEILYDISFDELRSKHQFTNFVELHSAWQKTLDTKELNKRFYSELFNWYLWAVRSVNFPNDIDNDKDDMVYNSENVIRLLTRLIFVWFIKEKNLVPDSLFELKKLKDILKDFKPQSAETSVYYRAVLQNLFFATLNTPMDKDITVENKDEKRRFINTLPKTGNDQYLDQTKYRYQNYFTTPDKALELFSSIPFLNGGLFECLDFKEGNKEIRLDGFSSTEKRQAFIPDKLFFAEKHSIDLNAEYGTKNKKYEVEGLINILDSYKFTITENTPLEEEIALDPELLGKVFENLLASYNPETQTTARKQTGSFYTPREIVNYMVDESLLAYFKQKLVNTEVLETKLRDLFTHVIDLPEFTKQETDVFIKSISEVKILDPACGSGAFPMGVLHRLVDLLNKLDPDNKKWNELQKQRAIAETAEVFDSGDVSEREIRLNEINKAFDLSMNYPDYARKLFLIENCIYGVDIQQIAIQISKLRFFISLIVDQKVDDSKPNRNILSMPNLETKFVAANTLIGLDKPQQMTLMAGDVERLEKELGGIRSKIFFTRKYSEKKILKKKEKAKREELQVALTQSGFSKNVAGQMAGWNPFDPMQSAKFFDPEAMFGFKDGFDVVIGNPPFISYYARRSAKLDTATLRYFQANYDFITDTKLDGKFNSIMFFIEKACKLMSKKASTFFILDIAFNDVPYRYIRKYLLENSSINKLLTGLSAFENVYSDQILLQYSNEPLEKRKNNLVHYYSDFKNIELNYKVFEQKLWLSNKLFAFALPHDNNLENIFTKIEKFPTLHQLFPAKLVRTCLSLAGHEDEFLLENNKSFKAKPVLSYIQNAKNLPVRYSEIVNPVQVVFDEELRDKLNQFYRKDAYNEIRRQPKALGLGSLFAFTNPKLFVRQSADKIIATYTDIDCAANTSFYIISERDEDGIQSKISLKYLLAILNSKLLSFYALEKKIIITGDKKQPQMMIKPFKTLPIAPLSAKEQNNFITIVDKILSGKKEHKDTSGLEKQIDKMVYKLYELTEEEIKIIEGKE